MPLNLEEDRKLQNEFGRNVLENGLYETLSEAYRSAVRAGEESIEGVYTGNVPCIYLGKSR